MTPRALFAMALLAMSAANAAVADVSYTQERELGKQFDMFAREKLPLVRFEVTLSDKQSLTISVPGKLGEPGKALEISRAGDKLLVSAPTEKLAVTGTQAVGD